MLINKVKALFAAIEINTQRPEGRNLELACAALMFEVARADFAIEAAEQQAVRDLLTREFGLSLEELAIVTEEAAERVDQICREELDALKRRKDACAWRQRRRLHATVFGTL